MTLEEELFQLEEGFWLAGEDHFLTHLDAVCLLAFPQQGQMHGAYPREQIAKAATAPGRWRDLKMSARQMLQPADNIAVITYRADVLRQDGQPYSALVSSGYVSKDTGWKLMLHQHSPV